MPTDLQFWILLQESVWSLGWINAVILDTHFGQNSWEDLLFQHFLCGAHLEPEGIVTYWTANCYIKVKISEIYTVRIIQQDVYDELILIIKGTYLEEKKKNHS